MERMRIGAECYDLQAATFRLGLLGQRYCINRCEGWGGIGLRGVGA